MIRSQIGTCFHFSQVNEVKGSIKFQLKKVLCLGVAIGHVGMEENQIRGGCPVAHARLPLLGSC